MGGGWVCAYLCYRDIATGVCSWDPVGCFDPIGWNGEVEVALICVACVGWVGAGVDPEADPPVHRVVVIGLLRSNLVVAVVVLDFLHGLSTMVDFFPHG